MARRNNLAQVALTALLSAASSVVGGWLLYSRFFVNHRLPLPPAIGADQERMRSEKAGFLNYYVDRRGGGRPLVLIHSINAAASAYEMRPIFDRYKGTRPVYALDLPGFGFSERADREYSPQLYTDAIIDFISAKVGGTADVVALSLGCEFAARAALQRPELFNTLALISPTGFVRRKQGSQAAADTPGSDLLYGVFSFPLYSQAFFDLLTTRTSIVSFLDKSFEGPVDPGLAAYAYVSAHQPGARYAPLYFISGKLFSSGIRPEVYEKLTLPVLVIHDLDPYVRFDVLYETVGKLPNWQTAKVVPTRGLPQFEKMEETGQALDAFWAQSIGMGDALNYLNSGG